MPKLRLHSPASIPGLGAILPIAGDDVTVGRAPDNQLVIPDGSVSPHHARLRRMAGGWMLTDLGNTNGIWVGVKRVAEHRLRAGQLFRIGAVALEFVEDAEGAPARAAPAPLRAFDSAIRTPPAPADPTVRDAERPSREPSVHTPNSLATRPATEPGRFGLRTVVVGLLAMVVLGFAMTFGGYFALRWMSHLQRAVNRAPVASASPTPSGTAAPIAPDALVADQAVADMAQEQHVDVPDTFHLTLPPNALHTPTHLVVARVPKQGTPFCDATDFAGPVFEVSTASNPTWARPARIELPVDVEQLARTHVAALAIGLYEPSRQEWLLLPTEYDPTRRIARAEFWQPGQVALFFARNAEAVATSEHFALVLEAGANPSKSSKSSRDRVVRALAQLESALTYYRAAGYRVPGGTLWVCAGNAVRPRARAQMPVVNPADLARSHSHGLARAAFIALWPGYLNSHSIEGREFWFDAMSTAIASQALGARATGTNPSLKRLASPLVAEDAPTSPLFANILARLEPGVELSRLWSETTRIMSELDTKAGAEVQSRVIPVDLALEQLTHKNLLSHYADFVRERLLSSGEPASGERCASLATLAADAKGGMSQLDVPSQYTARWTCISLIVPAGGYRSVRLQWASEPPPDLNLQLIRTASGLPIDLPSALGHSSRLDLEKSETLILVGVDSNMARGYPTTLRYEDVSIEAAFDPATPLTVRPGQIVSSVLQLTKIFPESKNLVVEWDYGDGSPKNRSNVTADGTARAEQQHAWARGGDYALRAAIFDAARPDSEIGFAVRQMTVQPVRLELLASESNPQTDVDVQFSIRATGPLPDSPQYRLNFGDNTEPSIVSSSEATHRYARAGQYAVTVELLSETQQVVTTSSLTLSVRAADVPVPVEPAASSASVQ